jgi:hypothetical protein
MEVMGAELSAAGGGGEHGAAQLVWILAPRLPGPEGGAQADE